MSDRDTLTNLLREKLASRASTNNIVAFDTSAWATEWRTSPARVLRAARDLDRKRKELRREFDMSGRLIAASLLPKFFVYKYDYAQKELSVENENKNTNESLEKPADRTNYVRPYLNGLRDTDTYSYAHRENPNYVSRTNEDRMTKKPVVMARYPVDAPVAENDIDLSPLLPKATAYVSYLSSPSESPLPMVTSKVMIHDDILPLVEEVAKMIAVLSYLIPKSSEKDQSVAKMLLS